MNESLFAQHRNNEKSARRDANANTARCLCRRDPSSISVPNLKRIAQFVQKLLGGPEIMKLVNAAPATPTYGSFYGPCAGSSVLYVCTKFESGSSFRLKVIRRSRNFEIGSRDHGHAQLGVVLHSLCRRGQSCISVPNSGP